MPSNIPVPSKGALRTLRHLAMGTSCTVAFSAGMLTEDRSRRLHAAREVHDNAQRIKCSKNYHSTSSRLDFVAHDQTISLEESILLTTDAALRRLTKETNEFLPGNLQGRTGPPEKNAWRSRSEVPSPTGAGHAVQLEDPKPVTVTGTAHSRQLRTRKQSYTIPLEYRTNGGAKSRATTLDSGLRYNKAIRAPKQAKDFDRQVRLASDVTRLLDSSQDSTDIDAAALRLMEAFQEGVEIPKSGLDPQLLHAASVLSRACVGYGKIEFAHQIMDIVLKHSNAIDEAYFQHFSPHLIIGQLLDKVRGQVANKQSPVASIEKACSIYLMKYTEDSNVDAAKLNLDLVISQGQKLMQRASSLNLYRLVHGIYFRIDRYSKGKHSSKEIEQLIIATHEIGQHKKTFRLFKRFHANLLPEKVSLSNVVRRVVESVIRSSIDDAEFVLRIADTKAKAGGFESSTTPILKVIGHHWRSTRDLRKTIDLFERIEPLVRNANHPEAAYITIIRYCIEADDEDLAISYRERLLKFYTPSARDVRLHGEFALAKARRKDWKGVKADLDLALNPRGKKDFSIIFLPIFKLYAKSHSVSESENFVRRYIDQNVLELTPFISNHMIHVYAASRELDSLVRWLGFSEAAGCPTNVVSVNTILHHCSTTWNFSFHEAYLFYKSICDQSRGSKDFVNQRTLECLGQIAQRGNPTPEEYDKRMTMLKELGRKKHPWNTQGVFRAMNTALGKGDPEATLRIYDAACQARIPLPPQHLTTIVKAHIEIGNAENALSMIMVAHDRGEPVEHAVAHLLIHQISSGGQSKESVAATMDSLETAGIGVCQSILTHTMSMLCKQNNYEGAIGFWLTMSKRPGFSGVAIKLPTLTVLTEAYIGLRSRQGIVWVMQKLSQADYFPDTKFYLSLKTARHDFEKQHTGRALSQELCLFRDTLGRLISQVKGLRQERVQEKRHVQEMTLKIINSALIAEKQVSIATEYATIGDRKVDAVGVLESSKRLWEGDKVLLEVDSPPTEEMDDGMYARSRMVLGAAAG
ncbi:hypothetical protein BJ875DRAFT_463475 [Amylocarpus encephaloides]|uniref:Pentacotripeptide-repeat region of PRORP domain-containing protein n=1 Tax=Amylocarpus encephaloides TaxID=45428 RepID=A0A9P7YHH0_9HELO|nr:hypothetical protein BJ875DRAFT_463475 [Amylocarpus encephaloides]